MHVEEQDSQTKDWREDGQNEDGYYRKDWSKERGWNMEETDTIKTVMSFPSPTLFHVKCWVASETSGKLGQG